METEKELKEEIEKLIDDDNTIEDYSETLKEIEENWGEDLQTGMFILLKVTKLKTLQERNVEVKQAIEEKFALLIYDFDEEKDIRMIEKREKELLQKLGLGDE